MKFYASLERILNVFDIDEKERLLERAFYCLQKNEIEESFPLKVLSPSYASFCEVVDPRRLPLRKDFDSNEGMAKLLHAIAHIEYSAIDLAIDAVYRFQDMPFSYKFDWLEVAKEEIRHFKFINEILNDLGYKYGDFPVHTGLMDAAFHTSSDVLERIAVIPRYYEASGLDVNPQIMRKVKSSKHPLKNRVLKALDIIYKEEISHVYKGDKWFKYVCEKRGLSKDIYFEILKKYSLLNKNRPHLNIEGRKMAGFSCDEILKLGAKECK